MLTLKRPASSNPSSPVKKARLDQDGPVSHKRIIFFFNPADEKLLVRLSGSVARCSEWHMMAVSAYTPTGISRDNVSLVRDNGTLAKRYKLLDPLGGGVYPMSAIVIQHDESSEVLRLRYDARLRSKSEDEIVYEVMKMLN